MRALYTGCDVDEEVANLQLLFDFIKKLLGGKV